MIYQERLKRLLIGLAVAMTLLVTANLEAASGRFHDGVFDLIVTLGWNAGNAEITTIQGRFNDARELPLDATDGETRLRIVYIFNVNTGLESPTS